jgi:hypothetical protein
MKSTTWWWWWWWWRELHCLVVFLSLSLSQLSSRRAEQNIFLISRQKIEKQQASCCCCCCWEFVRPISYVGPQIIHSFTSFPSSRRYSVCFPQKFNISQCQKEGFVFPRNLVNTE